MTSNEKPKLYSAHAMSDGLAKILRNNFDIRMGDHSYPTQEEILEGVKGVDVIYCLVWHFITNEVLESAGPKLKIVFTHSAGYDHIDLAACKKRNIRVGYFGKLVAGSMAEYTIGLMIATGYRFKEVQGEISQNFGFGYQLNGATVGIVGLGNIGQELARLLKVFNVEKIMYTCPRKKPAGDILGLEYVDFNELLQQSDFVVGACALSEKTKKIFNREAFKLMKPTAIFINVSRGAVVDQEALYEALTTNEIFASGLDVTTPEPLPTDHPLMTLKNCVILPHMGTLEHNLQKQMIQATVDSILAGVKGEPMPAELLL